MLPVYCARCWSQDPLGAYDFPHKCGNCGADLVMTMTITVPVQYTLPKPNGTIHDLLDASLEGPDAPQA